MRAVVFSRYGDESVLDLTERPAPAPADGEILVEVKAAGVNPVDWKHREGAVRNDRPFPLGMGWDVAGVVRSTVPGGPAVGEAVYGMLPLPYGGAYQELAALPASAVAPKPARLSYAEAAAVPLAALTAWQALEAAGARAGLRVLVHAGAGGVGHFAVQFARHLGAHVTATASARNLDFVRRLGADEPVDRATTDLAAADPFDIVLDTVGGPVQHASWRLLRPGGSLVTLPEPVDEAHRLPGIAARRIIVTPDGQALRRIGALIDAGAVDVEVQAVLPLEEAAEAHRISSTGRVRGKLALLL
ncbi:NADP-dependent oxidoreductase [Streptomyces sp. R302]|uniref:NADP-dependent oxidoreductase n=1 Tax=unclassified Streptomyces TaxID=2593676 RepID=UPI00145C939C|nr:MULTISPECIES: NADP-dependent oxidoreductase [unclassified Streptomyces]NML54103.1 NADP-dependent oxidoreductase [Streptomyces sp. R301]NML83363.1 NADP-dependent oxidoreductase [Streptomyces sp. R302]